MRWRNCLDPFTMQQIGFAENAEHVAIGIDDGQSANVVIDKQPHRRRDLVIRPDCDDVPDHHIAGVHFSVLRKSRRNSCRKRTQL